MLQEREKLRQKWAWLTSPQPEQALMGMPWPEQALVELAEGARG